MPGADHQRLRLLTGRYVLERLPPDAAAAAPVPDVLAVVQGPDGGARMRRDDSAAETWVAFWNGDQAHPPEATGMLAALVAPLAAGRIPVWVAASFNGDLVFVPAERAEQASALLRRAGHHVTGPEDGGS